MALIKCAKCGKEISDNAPDCIYCGNLLNQNMFNNENDSVWSNCNNPLSTFRENEIIENIAKIKETADIVKIFFKISASISLVVGFVSILFGIENGSSFVVLGISCCIMGGILLFVSSIIETFIKWKAYMLETNYKIVKNTECEKNGFIKL